MDRLADLKSDFVELGRTLAHVVVMLDDADSKLNGSDAASIVRERRLLGELIQSIDFGFDAVGPLREDYDQLADALEMSAGASSAVIVRERRTLSARLEQLESPEVVPYVDEVAARRDARTGDSGPPARRRKSRGG